MDSAFFAPVPADGNLNTFVGRPLVVETAHGNLLGPPQAKEIPASLLPLPTGNMSRWFVTSGPARRLSEAAYNRLCGWHWLRQHGWTGSLDEVVTLRHGQTVRAGHAWDIYRLLWASLTSGNKCLYDYLQISLFTGRAPVPMGSLPREQREVARFFLSERGWPLEDYQRVLISFFPDSPEERAEQRIGRPVEPLANIA